MLEPDFPTIPEIETSLEDSIQSAIDQKTKPLGALGLIEQVALKIALIQGTTAPVSDSCELLLFAADHGVAASGVSAYPAEVTRQMVLNFLAGGSAANVFARQNGVALRVIDAGVAGEALRHPELLSHRIGPGTANFIEGPAMSVNAFNEALSKGISLGMGASSRFVALGEMGIGNTSAATMLVHKMFELPLASLVGRGTGLDDAALANKYTLLQTASERTGPKLLAREALCEYGGFEIVMMAGAMIGAAANRKCVLVDGFIATAAFMAARELVPEISAYALFTHHSAEAGHAVMLDVLGERALLGLDLRLGEGTGALLAWPIIQCAAHMLTDMASFESSGVSEKS